tara:strand:- start:945 stop:1643 length:699 start_codon:yes stop_codon:yes gene_type:complete
MAFAQETLTLATTYCTDRDEYNRMKNNNEISLIEDDLMVNNFSDYNFSPLAEEVPVHMLGYSPYEPKHGYDGYIGGETYALATNFLEVKPQKSYFSEEKNKVMNKLNGKWAFADYTAKRYQKDVELGTNLRMVIPGYIHGELIYIISFPFNYSMFIDRIKILTDDAVEKNKARSVPSGGNKFFRDCSDLRVDYSISENKLDRFYKDKFITEDIHTIVKDAYSNTGGIYKFTN